MQECAMNTRFTLSLHNFRFGYTPDEQVIDIRSMDFPSARITVLLGGNGTGKTTLLKLIAGILKQQEGTLAWDTAEKLSQQNTLYFHQVPYLLNGTVEQHMKYLLPELKSSSTEEIELLLERLGLKGFAKRSIQKLSGGERKRAALACALAAGRPVLLMDEPTAHMDKAGIALLESAVIKLRDAGAMVIMATHNREFAFRLADSIWMMESSQPRRLESSSIRGAITRSDAYFSYFTAEGAEPPVELKVVHTDTSVTTAVIESSDIILSTHPLESSARNTLQGKVTAIAPREDGDTVIVTHDCGIPLKVSITNRSRESMDITVGSTLYAIFKTSSIKLF